MEYLSYKDRLRELRLFSLDRRLWGDLNAAFDFDFFFIFSVFEGELQERRELTL